MFAAEHNAREPRHGGLFVLACDRYRSHFKTLWHVREPEDAFSHPVMVWTCALPFFLLAWWFGTLLSLCPNAGGHLCSHLYHFLCAEYTAFCMCLHQTLLSVSFIIYKEIGLRKKNEIRFINTSSWRHRRDALADLTILGLVLSWKYQTAHLLLNQQNWPKNFTMWITSSPLTVCKAGGLNKSIVF